MNTIQNQPHISFGKIRSNEDYQTVQKYAQVIGLNPANVDRELSIATEQNLSKPLTHLRGMYDEFKFLTKTSALKTALKSGPETSVVSLTKIPNAKREQKAWDKVFENFEDFTGGYETLPKIDLTSVKGIGLDNIQVLKRNFLGVFQYLIRDTKNNSIITFHQGGTEASFQDSMKNIKDYHAND